MGGGKTQVVQQPAAPNYQESMRSILQAQIDLAPQVYASEEIYQPKYQALQDQLARQAAQSQIGMYQQLQPAYSQLEEDYMKSQQAAQLRGLQQRGGEYVQAFQDVQGVGGINRALQQYAQQKLGGLQANGTNLSPEEQRSIEQQTRAGYATRGTALGAQSNLAEVLNRYNARQAREQQLVALGTGLGGYFQQQAAPALTSFYQQPMYAGSFGGQAAQNAMMSQQQAKFIILISDLPLRSVLTIISKSKCVFCLDSAPLYMAQACRVPAISVWGPHSPRVRIGYDKAYMDLAIHAKEACPNSPCFAYSGFPERKCPEQEAQKFCTVLANVGVNDIMEKLSLLEQ